MNTLLSYSTSFGLGGIGGIWYLLQSNLYGPGTKTGLAGLGGSGSVRSEVAGAGKVGEAMGSEGSSSLVWSELRDSELVAGFSDSLREREGGMEGGREEGKEGGREGRMEEEREGRREGREGGREGGSIAVSQMKVVSKLTCSQLLPVLHLSLSLSLLAGLMMKWAELQ